MDFSDIANISDQQGRTSEYYKTLDSLLDAENIDELSRLVEHLLAGNNAVTKSALEYFSTRVNNLNLDKRLDLLTRTVDLFQNRAPSFEDILTSFRQSLSDCFLEQENYIGAARALSKINLENGKYNNNEKAQYYVRITELFLEEDETIEADTYLNRAAQYISDCKDEEVRIRHKVSYARILDSRRKFLEASQRYYELSTGNILIRGQHVKEEDLVELLTKAVTCAILAKASAQRTRVLATLTRDERTHSLPTAWPVLNKMYNERLLKSEEVQAFERSLQPHQKATLADGSTVLERAVLEHNVLAASRLYMNILLTELAKLLEVTPTKAEQVASRMIGEGRLDGTIDQIEGILEFESSQDGLQKFDERIKALSSNIGECANNIEKQYPELIVNSEHNKQ